MSEIFEKINTRFSRVPMHQNLLLYLKYVQRALKSKAQNLMLYVPATRSFCICTCGHFFFVFLVSQEFFPYYKIVGFGYSFHLLFAQILSKALNANVIQMVAVPWGLQMKSSNIKKWCCKICNTEICILGHAVEKMWNKNCITNRTLRSKFAKLYSFDIIFIFTVNNSVIWNLLFILVVDQHRFWPLFMPLASFNWKEIYAMHTFAGWLREITIQNCTGLFWKLITKFYLKCLGECTCLFILDKMQHRRLCLLSKNLSCIDRHVVQK